MPSFRNERRVRHRSDQMFDLVADVERYPEFVPLCNGVAGAQPAPRRAGARDALAEMSVGYKMIRETFTSRVLLDKPRLRVVVEYIDGPFRHLENIWTFRDEPEPRAVGRHLLHRLRIPQPHARRADGRRCSTRRSASSPARSRSGRTRFTRKPRRRGPRRASRSKSGKSAATAEDAPETGRRATDGLHGSGRLGPWVPVTA